MKWLCWLLGHRIDNNETLFQERAGGGWWKLKFKCKRCKEWHTKYSQLDI